MDTFGIQTKQYFSGIIFFLKFICNWKLIGKFDNIYDAGIEYVR
jgi:hypothetical protein